MQIADLLKKYTVISNQISKDELLLILGILQAVVATIEGDVVELGCYKGTTSLFIRRILNEYNSPKAFHVYDSFEGLPNKVTQDQSAVGECFKAGELDVSKKQFLHEFQRAHLQAPIIHKAWFDDLTDADLPPTIAFAFLDGDFYQSILTSLKLVWPRMAPGGMIAIHDYHRATLPGVAKAVEDFFHGTPKGLQVRSNVAILKK
jgi:O-methyltransferase